MKKLIKNNWQIIIFFIITIILVIVWCNHVDKTNNKITNQKNNNYEMELI